MSSQTRSHEARVVRRDPRAGGEARAGQPAPASAREKVAGPQGESRGAAIDRRALFKTMALATACLSAAGRARGDEGPADETDCWAVLIDTTRCVGCRSCEAACCAAHGLSETDDASAVAPTTRPTDSCWSVVSAHQTSRGEVFAKRQCMHCLQPACAAACLTKALIRNSDGAVTWREGKCMGCRYCMICCPFDLPRFEYESPVPKIQKCDLCAERLRQGEPPVCVESCPADALAFGRRSGLLREARRRILADPDDYVDHIYGEREAGGTAWLYLAAVPFRQLGFSETVGEEPYPGLTQGFLYSVPFILALWPAFLLALSRAAARDELEARADSGDAAPESADGGRISMRYPGAEETI